jgi:hypothetical protein
MNARLGIILRKASREALLAKAPRKARTWGDETIEVGGDTFTYAPLAGFEFKVYPLRGFVRTRVPPELQTSDTEYASMEGVGVEAYEAWIRDCDPDAIDLHPAEAGILSLIEGVRPCAVMLVSDDKLEVFRTLQPVAFIRLLRANMRELPSSRGFLVTIPGA